MYINLITIDFNPGQGGGVNPSGTLDISENGVYNVYTYASASVDVHPSVSLSETYISNGSYNITGEFNGGVITVDVPAPQFVTETLNVSANGTYTPGQGVDGYSQVVVDVPQSVTGFTEKEITEGIKVVNLSNSASYVHPFVFEKDTYLKTVYLPNCTSVGSYAFKGCTSLTQVSLPVCSYIGDQTFYNCMSLTQISLPVCSYIGEYGFGTCPLTQISLPMCEYIGKNTFYYCTSLTQVSLPVCSYIGGNAFYNCKSLTQISLPVCNYISNYAFENCSSLSIITIGYSGICSLYNSKVFSKTQITSSTGSIYVPTSLVDAYKSATNWSYFSTQIFPIE